MDNANLRKKGIVIIDTREQNQVLKDAANEVRFLGHPGPNGENWSFDAMVVTKHGQVLTYERKTTADAISSMDKLERQTGYVTGLLVEWNLSTVKFTDEWQDPKYRLLVENVEKRMWRLAHRQPVIFTHDVEGTVRYLRYIAGKNDLMDVRGAPQTPWAFYRRTPGLVDVWERCTFPESELVAGATTGVVLPDGSIMPEAATA